MIKTINVLGTKYKVITDVPVWKDSELANRFGYCSFVDHRIVVADLNTIDLWKNESESVKLLQKKSTLRHEIIHAFLAESGLRGSSSSVEQWALHEEMIDCFALQLPKIIKVFKELDCEGV
jgi:hypothetical protein